MSQPKSSDYFKEKKAIIQRRYAHRKEFFILLFILISGSAFMAFLTFVVFAMTPFWVLIFSLIFFGLLVGTVVKGLEMYFEGQRDAAILQEIELEREREYQMLLMANQRGKAKRDDERRLRLAEDGEIEAYFEPEDSSDEDEDLRNMR